MAASGTPSDALPALEHPDLDTWPPQIIQAYLDAVAALSIKHGLVIDLANVMPTYPAAVLAEMDEVKRFVIRSRLHTERFFASVTRSASGSGLGCSAAAARRRNPGRTDTKSWPVQPKRAELAKRLKPRVLVRLNPARAVPVSTVVLAVGLRQAAEPEQEREQVFLLEEQVERHVAAKRARALAGPLDLARHVNGHRAAVRGRDRRAQHHRRRDLRDGLLRKEPTTKIDWARRFDDMVARQMTEGPPTF
jgi:hypothetical protein